MMAKRSISGAMVCKTEEPVFQVLRRTADEAFELAAGLSQLDSEIGRLLSNTEDIGLEIFQRADLIRQSLEGLAKFLDALSETIDTAATCDPVFAATDLGMQAQGRRLAPQQGASPASQGHPDPEVW